MALLPPADIEHDERGWHVRQGEIQLEGSALPPLLDRLSLTLEALDISEDLDQALGRDTDRHDSAERSAVEAPRPASRSAPSAPALR
jgi:hypothetical protein